MIKVTGGVGGARPPRGASPSRPKSGSFQIGETGSASAAPEAGAAPESASSPALGALIALQSDQRSGARNRAMAERMLQLLERLRDGHLSGRILKADLATLENAANAKLDGPDERIAALYEEIVLRARVEIAKIDRD